MGLRKHHLEVGQQFKYLTIIEKKTYLSSKDGRSKRTRFICKCVCGNIVEKESYRLFWGALSCGCIKQDPARKNKGRKKAPNSQVGSVEYMTWVRMRRRCNNPEDENYFNYGGRGISVCERWSSFENFFADMGKRPGKGYMIDRTNNNGNYEPSNCRWATTKESNRNKRSIRSITIDGVTKGLGEWADETAINIETIRQRLGRGWEPKEAVFGKIRQEMHRTGNRWRKRS